MSAILFRPQCGKYDKYNPFILVMGFYFSLHVCFVLYDISIMKSNKMALHFIDVNVFLC